MAKHFLSTGRRFLVYCQTEAWQFEAELFGKNRSFDVALHDWTGSNLNHPSFSEAEYVFAHKSQKWPGVKALLPKIDQHYDYYAFIDDDISISTEGLNYLFKIGEENNLDLFQAALSERSAISFDLFRVRYNCNIRRTQFVEVMMPVFSSSALKKVFHTFNESESGWGLDYIWAQILKFKNMAIIDSVVAEHLRPIRFGGEVTSRGMTRDEELKHLEKKYGFIPTERPLKLRMYRCFLHKIALLMPNKLQKLCRKLVMTMRKPVNFLRNSRNKVCNKIYAIWFMCIGVCHGSKKISAMVRVKNEDQFLRASILSIIDHIDEVVIVDNQSNDNTSSIICDLLNEYPNKIRSFSYNFSIARCGEDNEREFKKDPNSPSLLSTFYNWSMAKCSFPYVLKWDGDMIATDEFHVALDKFRRSNMNCLRFFGLNVHSNFENATAKKYSDEEVCIFPKKFVSFKSDSVYEVLNGRVLKHNMRVKESCYLHMKFCKRAPFFNCSKMQANRMKGYARKGDPLPKNMKEIIGVLQSSHAINSPKSIGSSSKR